MSNVYKFKIEKESDSNWLIAMCDALPGFVTQAESEEDLVKNIKEALSLYLEAQSERQGKGRVTVDPASTHIQELALGC